VSQADADSEAAKEAIKKKHALVFCEGIGLESSPEMLL
jgi:hypothetical protein